MVRGALRAEWLARVRTLERFSSGCHRVKPAAFQFLWIAANELPLRDELVPFLVARSGRALDEFARWAAPRRPVEWVLNMVQYVKMSITLREDLLKRFARSEDPEVEARRQQILETLLEASPDVKGRLIKEGLKEGLEEGQRSGRLIEARAALRRVLARRGLALTAAMEAQIEGCAELGTLERWLDQAVTAASAEEAVA